MNSILATENSKPPVSSALRLLPGLIILVAAVVYYGSYWHYWFNPHDEGGTVCLVTQRLMHGERPWVDVEPGYNVGWFYPLKALFHFTGVNYLAARAWFFALSTVTALLGCGIVSRVTGSRWFGLAVGLALVAFPGSQFKNYIPLAAAANTACLILLVFIDPLAKRKWWGAALLGGFVLGLTYLVRVDLGFFFTAIWLLLLLLTLLDRRAAVAQRLAGLATGLVCLVLGIFIAQAPAYSDLRSRGLEKQYWEEYSGWFGFLSASAKDRIQSTSAPANAPAAPDATAVPATPAAGASTHAADGADRSTLPRKPLSSLMKSGWHDRILIFLTYAPFVGFAIFLICGIGGFFRAVFRGEFTLSSESVQRLLLVGGSLTTFPQFFFFRPDRPHLSEFMVGYIIAMSTGVWMLWPRGEVKPLGRKIFAGLVGGFLAVQFAVFAFFALEHPSAGTIAARTGRKTWFRGENGVAVKEFKREASVLQGVHDVVMKSSSPEDYVICFPYMPGFNVMTNRPTYLHNVYVDNATRGEHWAEQTIQDFEEKHPAVVIIDNRPINGTESSRFKHWGAPVYHYLQKNYTPAGVFETVEVFVKPTAAPAPAAAVQ